MAIIGGRAHTIEQIHEVGKLGYPFAEISLYDPVETRGQMAELLNLKERYGLFYLAHYPNEGNPANVDALGKKFVPKVKALVDLTCELGISKATLHFWIDKRWATPELISAKIDLLSDMVGHATEKNVMLCLENLSEHYDSFALALDAIPDLRMTLDIGHAQLLSKENTSFDFIEHLYHKIGHIHVHDNFGGTSVKDDLHLPLGDGVVDFPKIFSMLRARGYGSTVTMEVKPPDMLGTKEKIERYLPGVSPGAA